MNLAKLPAAIKRFLSGTSGRVVVAFGSALAAQPVVHSLIANALAKSAVISAVVGAAVAAAHKFLPKG